MSAWCIVTAAGSGERMGAGENKLFLSLAGWPVLAHTLLAVERSGCFSDVVLSVRRGEEERVRAIAKSVLTLPFYLATGGDTRQESVSNALALILENAEVIAVTDGARCFASPELFRRCVKSAEECGSGVAGSACADTVKRGEGGIITETLDRSRIILAQTPQVFEAKLLRRAYAAAAADGFLGTDDSSLVERLGVEPALVLSEDYNGKLTHSADYTLARRLLGSDLRTGHGRDAHRLVAGRTLVLCGVRIPFEMGLLGHSDADVASHAVIDALFGAAGLPDIGAHFPDSDERFSGADSLLLLRTAADELAEKGFEIINIDVTIAAQKPKLAPYIAKMRERLAAAARVPMEAVNVKATTTEGMGFTGRGEGIEADAVCLLRGL